MNKGGYKIVNFNGAALSSTPVTIAGIYDQIVDDYDKAVLVSGVSINSNIKDDAFANAQEKVANDSSKYVEISAYGGVITVTEDDEVTFASSSSVEELDEKIGDLDDLGTTDKDSVVDAINEVNEEVGDLKNLKTSNVLGTPVILNAYSTTDNYYELSNDGILICESSNTVGDQTVAMDLNNVVICVGRSGGSFNGYATISLRKGFKLYISQYTGNGAKFIPYV